MVQERTGPFDNTALCRPIKRDTTLPNNNLRQSCTVQDRRVIGKLQWDLIKRHKIIPFQSFGSFVRRYDLCLQTTSPRSYCFYFLWLGAYGESLHFERGFMDKGYDNKYFRSIGYTVRGDSHYRSHHQNDSDITYCRPVGLFRRADSGGCC